MAMKHKMKLMIWGFLLVSTVLIAAGCGQTDDPYQINDAQAYNVSVKFDANGGIFTTNTSVIVDSYNITDMKTNAGGKVEIPLLSPDNSLRGNDAFVAEKNGYFLAGWYAQRTQETDEAGNTVYSYADKWDFDEHRLEVDPNGTYSASEPVLTLYAAWIPLFEIRFHDLATGEFMQEYPFDPEKTEQILVPVLDEESGTMEMYEFPEKSGYTFAGAYLDPEGQQPITDAVVHPGTVDFLTGTANDAVLNVYIDWTEGEWFHIFRAEQLVDNASVSGNYVIHADLDFTDEIWPSSLMYGNFAGSIQGNGYTFRNISLEQTNNSKTGAGLFGSLTETASISDLTFENVTFTIKAGTRVAGTSYGLLAGSISGSAVLENVQIQNSRLQIDGNAYFGTDDYTIGLICGMGNTTLDYSGITAAVVGSDTLWAFVSDGQVVLTDDVFEITAETKAELADPAA